MKISELQEAIKGWKHAGSDLMKHRAAAYAAKQPAMLVSVKKDGTESKMHDAKTYHASEQAARNKHADIVKLNPGRNIRHNLYVDGQLVGMLDTNLTEVSRKVARAGNLNAFGEPVSENATSGGTSAGSIASLPMHQGQVIRRPNLFGYVPASKKHTTKSGKKSSPHK